MNMHSRAVNIMTSDEAKRTFSSRAPWIGFVLIIIQLKNVSLKDNIVFDSKSVAKLTSNW